MSRIPSQNQKVTFGFIMTVSLQEMECWMDLYNVKEYMLVAIFVVCVGQQPCYESPLIV